MRQLPMDCATRLRRVSRAMLVLQHSMHSAITRYLAAAALLCAGPPLVRGQQQPPPPPSLVVFIAIDQMRADYFERFAPQLTGGLGRLYRGGAVLTNASHDHAITETAPGHSVMLSGRFPRTTGIVTNATGVPDQIGRASCRERV